MRAAACLAAALLPVLAAAEDSCEKQRAEVEKADSARAALKEGMRVTTPMGPGKLKSRYEDKADKGKKAKKKKGKWWVSLDKGELSLNKESELRAEGEEAAASKRLAKLGNCLVKQGELEEARAVFERALGGDAANHKARDALRGALRKLAQAPAEDAGRAAHRGALSAASALLALWEDTRQAKEAAGSLWGLWAGAVAAGAVPSMGPVLGPGDLKVLSEDPWIAQVDGYLSPTEIADLRGLALEERKVRERRLRIDDRQWCFNGDAALAKAAELGAALDQGTGCTPKPSPVTLAAWRRQLRPQDTVFLQKGVDPRLDRILWRLSDEWRLPFALAEQAQAVRLHQMRSDGDPPVAAEGTGCADGGALSALFALDDTGEVSFGGAGGLRVPFKKGRLLLWRRQGSTACPDPSFPPAAERRDALLVRYAGAKRYPTAAKAAGTVEASFSLGPQVPTAVRGRAETTECFSEGGAVQCRRVVGKPELGNEKNWECHKFPKCSSCTRAGCAWCVADAKCKVAYGGHPACLYGPSDQAGSGGSGTCDSSLWPYPERRRQDQGEFSQRFQVPPPIKIAWSGSGSSGESGFSDEDEFAQ
eukprot:TRINITY_DN27031_c0_g1_i1.p1 TRINITY_DN27031_c0_g1~~TRINITY_DN27031_c0_g1_i1.p1  ORF type:complete len:622 (+),score=206.64 TRINITY_DN27031_c0_g1_i1:95-1867(+)